MLPVIMAPDAATAFVLDWDTVGWPGGSSTLTNTYTDVDGSGWSVQVQLTDPDSNLVQTSPDSNPSSPSTNVHLNPATNSGNNLFVRADTNGGGVGITIRFDFTHSIETEVTDIVLSLFDVDTADAPSTQWIDSVSITGFAAGGGSVLPDSVTSPTGTPTWTYNGGTGLLLGDVTQGNAGNNDDDGTATITFNTAITGFELTYLNGFAPGGNQWIAFSDVSFVPEPNTFSLLLLGLVGLSIRRRRA
jgi:hypothetical protein